MLSGRAVPFARIAFRRTFASASGQYIAVIDEGTTSTRTALFNHGGDVEFTSQQEFTQIMPKKGLVEHDPIEILETTKKTMNDVMEKASAAATDVSCIGITNQRETTIIWDRKTGRPLHNAIVWMDTRADEICHRLQERLGGGDALRAKTGLPIHAYFSGPKVQWLIENVDEVKQSVVAGDAMFGTIDTWLLWNLTGGANGGGVHETDVSNASRTLLMDLETLDWDDELLQLFGIPRNMLPKITPSSRQSTFGTVNIGDSALDGVPITGILGDQQAALFGQGCFEPGRAKCTYGTGAFALKNTGNVKRISENGLLTTVGYQLEGHDVTYALEGSVAIGGAVVQWLRDNLGIISKASEVNDLAATVEDNGGTYFIPAFSGLYAPHWREDARGCIVGMTRFVTKAHIARAALESIAFQVNDVLGAMASDSGVNLRSLHVDGGATDSDMLMQFQSDIVDLPVVKPKGASNTTALGAAFAAGLGSGVYSSTEEIVGLLTKDKQWEPDMEMNVRSDHLRQWNKGIERSLGWADEV